MPRRHICAFAGHRLPQTDARSSRGRVVGDLRYWIRRATAWIGGSKSTTPLARETGAYIAGGVGEAGFAVVAYCAVATDAGVAGCQPVVDIGSSASLTWYRTVRPAKTRHVGRCGLCARLAAQSRQARYHEGAPVSRIQVKAWPCRSPMMHRRDLLAAYTCSVTLFLVHDGVTRVLFNPLNRIGGLAY